MCIFKGEGEKKDGNTYMQTLKFSLAIVSIHQQRLEKIIGVTSTDRLCN